MNAGEELQKLLGTDSHLHTIDRLPLGYFRPGQISTGFGTLPIRSTFFEALRSRSRASAVFSRALSDLFSIPWCVARKDPSPR